MTFAMARVAPKKQTHRLPAMAITSGGQGEDMATKMTYAEQLLHPKWQRKRLEILERADFKCEECGDAERTLHVHHKQYVKGRKAWEYEGSELRALCEGCHKLGHETRDALLRLLASTFAEEVSVETFAYGFLCGMLSPWGSVLPEDVTRALENEPRFFGMGYMIAALGPADIVAAVRRKISEDRLPTDNFMLNSILEQEGGA